MNSHYAVGLDSVAVDDLRNDENAAVTGSHIMPHVSAGTFTPWNISYHAPVLDALLTEFTYMRGGFRRVKYRFPIVVSGPLT